MNAVPQIRCYDEYNIDKTHLHTGRFHNPSFQIAAWPPDRTALPDDQAFSYKKYPWTQEEDCEVDNKSQFCLYPFSWFKYLRGYQYRIIFSTPQIELPFIEKPKSKFEIKKQQFNFLKSKYESLLPMLQEKHSGKYVAIVGNSVEIHEDKDALFQNVIEKYGTQTMYISEITKKKRSFKVRSPRLKR